MRLRRIIAIVAVIALLVGVVAVAMAAVSGSLAPARTALHYPWQLLSEVVRVRAAMREEGGPRAAQDMGGFSGRRVVDYEPNDARLAIIPVNGLLMKEIPPCMYFVEGETGTEYADVRATLERALDDPQVDKIVLSIDSPGGYVAGGEDLADAVRAATQEKWITAAVQDLAASAAYCVPVISCT